MLRPQVAMLARPKEVRSGRHRQRNGAGTIARARKLTGSIEAIPRRTMKCWDTFLPTTFATRRQ